MNTPSTVKKKIRLFPLLLTGYAVLLLVVSAVVLNLLWGKMEDYEAGTSSSALTKFFQLVKDKQYDTLYENFRVELEGHPFNGKEQAIAYLQTVFTGDLDTMRAAQTMAPADDIGGTTTQPAAVTAAPSVTPVAQLPLITQPDEETEKYYNLYIEEKKVCRLRMVQEEKNGQLVWTVRILPFYLEPYQITVSQAMSVRINGVDLATAGLTPEDVSAEYFVGFSKENDPNRPVILRYTIDKLLVEPTVEAVSPAGAAGIVEKDAEKERFYTVYCPLSDETTQKAKELLTNIGQKYPRFIYREVGKANYLRDIYTDTLYYDGIKGFANWMYGDQNKSWFENFEIHELRSFSGRDFHGRITYDFMLQWGRNVRDEPANNTLTFVEIDGKWLLTHQQNHVIDEHGTITKQ